MNAAAARNCDVVVIGGGPAGSTAAALLARAGRQVVLLEKDRHPRFHIGESLLPANVPLFERLGVGREMASLGMEKWGATFVSPWHSRIAGFEFADGTDPSLPLAYQVRRSEFDEVLFRHAARSGAEALEQRRVRRFDVGAEGGPVVWASGPDGEESEWRPRFVVDATGRDTLFASRMNAKRRNRSHNSSAMYGHFRGARRDAGRREGNIIIFWFDHGWFWFIPLRDGVTSVGAVVWPYYMRAREKPLREYFLDTIALCPKLAERLQGAELVAEPEATGNYSYESALCQGENFILLGDAYAFIDPVFSSGVLLAMNSAFAGVDVVEARLAGDAASEARARSRFEHVMRSGPKAFSWFIYRVTNPTLRELFMDPSERFSMKKALITVLAGDIFGNTRYRAGLYAFRVIYYLFSVFNLRRSFAAWRRRAFNIRDGSDMSALTPR